MGYTHRLSPRQIEEGVTGSFRLQAQGALQAGGALQEGHQPTELRGQLEHAWVGWVYFGGSVFPTCTCGYTGAPGLTVEDARAQVCDVALAWQTSDARERMMLAVRTFGGVRR